MQTEKSEENADPRKKVGRDLYILLDNIYNDRTRDFAKEIISCYENRQDRAAIINLWIAVICDISYKLLELKDIHGESKAEKTLTWLEKTREEKTRESKYGIYMDCSWEYGLIEEVYTRYNKAFINDSLLLELQHLKTLRNKYAHPLLNKEFELEQPNEKITLGMIEIIFEKLFSKPAVTDEDFTIKFIIALEKNAVLLEKSDTQLAELVNRYFEKANELAKMKVFKTLWKFIFKLTNDDCTKNRKINTLSMVHIINNNIDAVFNEIKTNINNYDYTFDNVDKSIDESFLHLLSNISGLADLFPKSTISLSFGHIENNIDYLVRYGKIIYNNDDLWIETTINKFINIFSSYQDIKDAGNAYFRNDFNNIKLLNILNNIEKLSFYLNNIDITHKDVGNFFEIIVKDYFESDCFAVSNSRSLILRKIIPFFNDNQIEKFIIKYFSVFNSQITYLKEVFLTLRQQKPELVSQFLLDNIIKLVEKEPNIHILDEIIPLMTDNEITIIIEKINESELKYNIQAFVFYLKRNKSKEIYKIASQKFGVEYE